MQRLHYRVIAILLVYGILKFFGGSFGRMALYPVTLLVTFLHEFGHALGALLTGGSVDGMQINADGSGYTITRGGYRAIVLMGGYLGSAVLGNVLFHIGARRRHLTHHTLLLLGGLMLLAGLMWFQSFSSTAILWGFGALLAFIALKTDWDQDVLMFLGLASVLYIIQDFDVGPKSDLAMYEQVVGFFPSQICMYLWLLLVGWLFLWNLRQIFR
ncbi:MAG TPA: M50 family metallopeptidase [Saprospiraceae bacterium]|nr:M50 family metallopeptidase [Saprospiraceae bacterium]